MNFKKKDIMLILAGIILLALEFDITVEEQRLIYSRMCWRTSLYLLEFHTLQCAIIFLKNVKVLQ